eukprot:5479296-Alexandrium_andersonii.AAC.1
MQKLSEHRDRMTSIRLQAETGGAVKTRSQRFLADARAIQNGQSRTNIWQAPQRERQYQRNRVRRLDAALLAAQEG